MTSNNATNNITIDDVTHNMQATMLKVNIIISLCIISINLFVGFLFYRKQSLLKTPSNKLLLSLLVCDAFSGLIVFFHVAVDHMYKSTFALRIVVDILTAFLVQTFVMHLCGITLDRFLSLFFALRYKQIVTRSNTCRYITVAWILSFIAAAVQLTWLYKELRGETLTQQEMVNITQIEKWYTVIAFLFFNLIPMIMLGVAFSLMFWEIRKILLKTPTIRHGKLSNVTASQVRVFYVFGLMYACFAVCTMPYYTLRMLLEFRCVTVTYTSLELVYTLRTLTSLINPLLYTANNREFRIIICDMFAACKRKQPFRKISLASTQSTCAQQRKSLAMTSLMDVSAQDSVAFYETCLTEGDETRQKLNDKVINNYKNYKYT